MCLSFCFCACFCAGSLGISIVLVRDFCLALTESWALRKSCEALCFFEGVAVVAASCPCDSSIAPFHSVITNPMFLSSIPLPLLPTPDLPLALPFRTRLRTSARNTTQMRTFSSPSPPLRFSRTASPSPGMGSIPGNYSSCTLPGSRSSPSREVR